MTTSIHLILLGAGLGSRMKGPNKLLLPLGNKSVIEHTATELSDLNFQSRTLVTGFESEKVNQKLALFHFESVHNKNFESGMHSSIRMGINSLPHDGFVMIALGDQPEIRRSDYQKLILAAQNHPSAMLISPLYNGKRGNPVLISLKLKHVILAHPDNDRGCSYLFQDYPNDVISVPMDSASVLQDLDTPEDYQCLMTSMNSSQI